jgi:NDP-sugar pyrophosphorylase family protein
VTPRAQLAGVVLAAGAGTRLRPLTYLRPKALCPVANAALLDRALEAVRPLTAGVAVNVHHGRTLMEAHLADRSVHLSVEEPKALGTAGALGRLRPWVDGRAVLVANADAWRDGNLGSLVDGWDGERIRLLVVRDDRRNDFGPWRYAGAALLPWSVVRELQPEPSGLYEVCWGAAWEAGRLDLALHDGGCFDCGTTADYLAANLAANGGASVVGEGAVVEGELVRSVVWPGGRVAAGERLVDAVRVWDDLTVYG